MPKNCLDFEGTWASLNLTSQKKRTLIHGTWASFEVTRSKPNTASQSIKNRKFVSLRRPRPVMPFFPTSTNVNTQGILDGHQVALLVMA